MRSNMNRSPLECESRDLNVRHPNDSPVGWNSSSDESNDKRRSSLLKSLRWAALGIIIVLPIAGGIILIKASQFKRMGAATANQVVSPQPVNVAEVREE